MPREDNSKESCGHHWKAFGARHDYSEKKSANVTTGK